MIKNKTKTRYVENVFFYLGKQQVHCRVLLLNIIFFTPQLAYTGRFDTNTLQTDMAEQHTGVFAVDKGLGSILVRLPTGESLAIFFPRNTQY